MKKQNVCSLIVLSAVLLTLVMGCKFGSANSSDYANEADKFSIAFPGGAEGVKTETSSVKYAKSARSYSKFLDNKTPQFRSYGVQVLDIEDFQTAGKSEPEIRAIALNGWDKEKDTFVNENLIVQGRKGTDSLRTITVGSVSMTFRDVVFYSEADKKLYVVKIAASKKENAVSSEAMDFVNSFKLSKGWF